MFDFIFSIFEAWNAMGFFLMSGVFLLIGGGLIGHFLYWRLKGRRIVGRVSGIRVVENAAADSDSEDVTDSGKGNAEDKQGVPVVMSLFFIIFPMIFMGIGLWMAYTYFDLSASGVYADAHVVRNESSTDSDGDTSYKTVLSFVDRRGDSHEVRDTISYGGSPSYDQGQEIGVYYDPADPERFVIADFWHNMAISLGFIGFSSIFILLFAFILFFGGRVGSGKTKGVGRRRKSYAHEMYYPVYEYKTPQGERAEFVDSMGTGTFLHAVPGLRVRLLMSPGKEPKVKKAGVLGLIFGVIFLVPGILIGQTAVSQIRVSVGMIVLLLAVAGFIGFKILKILEKIPEAERKRGWKAIRSGEAFNAENITVTSDNKGLKGRLLTPDEIRVRAAGQAKVSRIAGFVMILIAIGLSVGAYYAGLSMIDLVQNGVRAEGEVTDLRRKKSDDSYVYHAVVRFSDSKGESRHFQDSMGSNPASFREGDRVTVLYLSEEPEGAIIDRGIFNWGLSGGLFAAALLIFWFAVSSFRLASRVARTGAYRTAL